jgi:hypothetical protein
MYPLDTFANGRVVLMGDAVRILHVSAKVKILILTHRLSNTRRMQCCLIRGQEQVLALRY